MINLTSADFANVVNFRLVDRDGYYESLSCVGRKLHVRQHGQVSYDGWGEMVEILSACDGSCVARTDVRKLIEELSDGRFPLQLDGEIRRMLRDNENLEAVLFEDSYAKRFSERKEFCLDGQLHVNIVTDFTWATGQDEDFVHSVGCSQCDGRCKALVDMDRRAVSLFLRQIRREERW